MDHQFLVAVRIGRYLTRLIDQSPITTGVPSTALHLDYSAADGMVQRLRDADFAEAHVCTVRGLPATPQDIFDAEHAQPTQGTK
jgi:hypothetical protein